MCCKSEAVFYIHYHFILEARSVMKFTLESAKYSGQFLEKLIIRFSLSSFLGDPWWFRCSEVGFVFYMALCFTWENTFGYSSTLKWPIDLVCHLSCRHCFFHFPQHVLNIKWVENGPHSMFYDHCKLLSCNCWYLSITGVIIFHVTFCLYCGFYLRKIFASVDHTILLFTAYSNDSLLFRSVLGCYLLE